MSWKAHLDRISKQAHKSVALLRRARPFLLPSALATIYKSHVRSRMEYCSPMWLGAPVTFLRRLDSVQSKAAKLLGPKVSSNLQTLAHRRGVSGFCLFHRILHGTAPSPLLDLRPPSHVSTSTRSMRHARPALTAPRTRSSDARYWTRSFLNIFTNSFNTLPLTIQSLSSLQPFKKAVNSSIDLTFL